MRRRMVCPNVVLARPKVLLARPKVLLKARASAKLLVVVAWKTSNVEVQPVTSEVLIEVPKWESTDSDCYGLVVTCSVHVGVTGKIQFTAGNMKGS